MSGGCFPKAYIPGPYLILVPLASSALSSEADVVTLTLPVASASESSHWSQPVYRELVEKPDAPLMHR
jgi:hypothetical protein